MDIERSIIAKIVSIGDIQTLLTEKITAKFFLDDEHRRVFSWMLDFWHRYGDAPTEQALRYEFPTYKLPITDEPYQFYVDELKENHKRSVVTSSLIDAATVADESPDEALSIFSQTLTQLGQEISVARDTNLIDTWQDRIDRYIELKNGGKMKGIPTGFPTMDEVTAGLQPEQLITLIGEPKAGKSTLLLRMAITVHQWGKVPLFVGFEMSNDEQEDRHDAMRASVNFLDLVHGKLSIPQEDKLKLELGRMKSLQPFYLSSDVTGATLSGLAAKIDQYRPDVLFVDGTYLMQDESGNDPNTAYALTNITRGLKRLAQQKRIPIVQTTQVLAWKVSKSKGLTADAIGYSSSFAQDSDVIFGVERTDVEDQMKLRIVVARNAPRREVLIKWDWTTGEFEEPREPIDEEPIDPDAPGL